MNIQPCKSECVPLPPKAAAKAAKSAKETSGSEAPQITKQQKLLTDLAKEPDVRAREVERGKALAADPGYPSDDLLAKLAEIFVNDARNSK